jgi:hypothetical protein
VSITLDDDFSGVILCLDHCSIHRLRLLPCLEELPLGNTRIRSYGPDIAAELPLSQIVTLLDVVVNKLLPQDYTYYSDKFV